MNRPNKYIRIRKVEKETARARLIVFNNGHEAWCPKSKTKTKVLNDILYLVGEAWIMEKIENEAGV